MTKAKACKDCAVEFDGVVPKRLAPHPGPRCATHWRIVVKARRAAAHESMVGRTYGLPPGHYDRLYQFQGGRCAWCQLAMGKTSRLPVDHDHKSGRPRGLLCNECNQFLGRRMRDDPDSVMRGWLYLKTSPYDRMLNQMREQ